MKRSLKELVKEGTIAVPGVFNAASALLAEKAGFEAVYVSGAGLANSRGLPDTGLLPRDEVVRFVSYITGAVSLPAIVDADTGFGGPSDAADTVRALEAAGAGAVQIEDQEFPKRCGHLPGKSVIPAKEFALKIKAAAGARKDRDFLIIARTDARAVEGIKVAIERANIYLEAGADCVFPEALESKEEFLTFAKNVQAPLMANMTEFGKSPYLTVTEMRDLGYSIVIFPMTAFRAAMKAMEAAFDELYAEGTQKGMLDKLQTREDLYRLLKYSF
jgi:methylisocitrate lyase